MGEHINVPALPARCRACMTTQVRSANRPEAAVTPQAVRSYLGAPAKAPTRSK